MTGSSLYDDTAKDETGRGAVTDLSLVSRCRVWSAAHVLNVCKTEVLYL